MKNYTEMYKIREKYERAPHRLIKPSDYSSQSTASVWLYLRQKNKEI